MENNGFYALKSLMKKVCGNLIAQCFNRGCLKIQICRSHGNCYKNAACSIGHIMWSIALWSVWCCYVHMATHHLLTSFLHTSFPMIHVP